MTKLVFKADDVRRVVEHSIKAIGQMASVTGYDERTNTLTHTIPEAASVCLVHDQGVYLMSNGTPRDIVSGESSFCAYARGCDPREDREWWDNARDLVGGNDFGDTLPWAQAKRSTEGRVPRDPRWCAIAHPAFACRK